MSHDDGGLAALQKLPPIDGKYRILESLGKGGVGMVFLVEHIGRGETFAMKVLHTTLTDEPEALARFDREVRVTEMLRSDHIVRTFDSGVAEDMGRAPYFVMERLQGTDLAAVIKNEGAQPASRVVAWLRQAADGVAAAHALGLVHRDLKPANLFLSTQASGPPIVKVLDFGMAKLMDDAGPLTATHARMGTARYMSPEQAKASRNATTRSDIWALGLIAYELLVGRPYYDGTRMTEVLTSILFAPLAPPSAKGASLPAAFDEWFLRSCNRDPEARFASSTEQMAALERALAT